MPISHLDANTQGITGFDLAPLEDLDYLDLSDNALSSAYVDGSLAQRVAHSMEDGYINLAGDNSNRTSGSDSAIEDLVDDGNIVFVNQANSATTILGTDVETGLAQLFTDAVLATRFTATADGLPNTISVRTFGAAPQQAMLALYTANGDEVGDFIVGTEPVDLVPGWMDLDISSVVLDNGVNYFICGNTTVANGIVKNDKAGHSRWLAATFSGFEWPATGAAWTTVSTATFLYRVRV